MTDYDKITEQYKARVRSPLTAIRAHCVMCMGGQVSEVSKCTSELCPLHPFRAGKNPFHARSRRDLGEDVESYSETENAA